MDEGRQCRSVRPNNLWPNEIAQSDDLTLLIAFSDYLSDFEANVFRRRHASSAASAKSQSRKIAIFGFIEVALGQTIQYVLDNFKLRSTGLASLPLITSHAVSVVRASATPWPSTAGSISMLARFRTEP
jgi:hypothetical protein